MWDSGLFVWHIFAWFTMVALGVRAQHTGITSDEDATLKTNRDTPVFYWGNPIRPHVTNWQSDPADPYWSIDALDNDKKLYCHVAAHIPMTVSTPGYHNGDYTWIIPDSVKPGFYYFHYTSSNKLHSVQGPFEVRQPNIVIQPIANQTFYPGNTITLGWENPHGPSVTISLLSGDSGNPQIVRIIATNVPVNQQFNNWKIPADLNPGKYWMELKNSNSNSTSFPFTIMNHSIKTEFIQPENNSVYKAGNIALLKWTYPMGDSCKLTLFKGSADKPQAINDIAASVLDNGTYFWTVPSSVTPGTYFLGLDNGNGNKNGIAYSVPFTIDAPLERRSALPQSDQFYYNGDKVPLSWVSPIGSNINLTLVDGVGASPTVVQSIATNIPDTGTFLWEVHNSVVPKNYFVRLTTSDGNVHAIPLDNATTTVSSVDGTSRDTSSTNSWAASRITSVPITLSVDHSFIAPNSGSTYYPGDPVHFKWRNPSGSKADIHLVRDSMKSATVVKTIGTGIEDNGAFSWTVPSEIAPGDYFVQLSTSLGESDSEDSAVKANVSASRITSVSATPTAAGVFTAPTPGSIFHPGGTASFRWNSPSGSSANISFVTHDTTIPKIVHKVAIEADNEGSYSWTIPTHIPAGTYRAQLKTPTGVTYSDPIIVKPVSCTSQTTSSSITPITVPVFTAPSSGTTFNPGDFVYLKWTHPSGSPIDLNLIIDDLKSPKVVTNITAGMKDDGFYSWKIPADLEAGTYRAQLKTANNVSYSNPFIIKAVSCILHAESSSISHSAAHVPLAPTAGFL